MSLLNPLTKAFALIRGVAFLIFLVGTTAPTQAETVNLKANFRLYGEVLLLGDIGWGGMSLHFGINAPYAAPEIGTFGFASGGASYATGVLEGLSLPPYVFTVVNRQFSVPFSLDVGQPASLYVGFNDNGVNGPWDGETGVIFDFIDNLTFGGSILGPARDQGLTLTSVTLADGTSLENAGLKFEFIPENTVLTAAASAADHGYLDVQFDTQIAAAAPCGRAIISLPNAWATAKLKGGFDFCTTGIATDALLDLDVVPEPDPYVYDVAYATVSGANNIKLTRIVSDTTGPVTTNVQANPNPAAVNTYVKLAAQVDDSAMGNSNIQSAEYTLDGDNSAATWFPMDPITFTNSKGGVTVTFASPLTPGVYNLCMRGRDTAGNMGDKACILFVAYDPNGGFVTGGGWIDSPKGAYMADPTLAAKANFGFVSKYQKGATIPTGNTEFQFEIASFNFHSEIYTWLVVNQAGTNAQYKGTGTINNEGHYQFMLWATDGSPDAFRIKIWSETESGAETVIYDNTFSQPIGGGSIVIHTK